MPHNPTHANEFTSIPNFSGGAFSNQGISVPAADNYLSTYGVTPESSSFSLQPNITDTSAGSGFNLFGQGGANLAAGISLSMFY